MDGDTHKRPQTPPKDKLRETVRFLGRVLGDVIREQDGQAVFGQIEAIRRASVAFHREPTGKSAQALAEQLERLSLPETVRFAHSFACFLQITNIAEDQLQRRRGRDARERPDRLAGAVKALSAEGMSAQKVLALLD
ncbi:MAG: ppc, partial [Caulobacteraceae bacterium]|nr:ppc [Caulobacteraceae bacterium]